MPTELDLLLSSGFLLRALAAAVLVGFITAQLGVFVVLRKMAFFSDAIAHASLTGIALGLLLSIHPVLGAVAFSVLVAVGIAVLQRRSTIAVDTVIGVFSSAAIASGVLLLSLLPGYRADLFGYLFGDILAVSGNDLVVLACVAAGTAALVGWSFRAWLGMAFHMDLAQMSGVRVQRMEYAYLLALALVVALGIKLVGTVLIGSLIVIPAAAAKNVALNVRSLFGFAMLFGIASGVVGLLAAYALDVAAGPAIVVTATAMFGLTFLVRR